MKITLFIGLLLLQASLISANRFLDKYHGNYQPVIGILTQPSTDLNQTQFPDTKYQYISSSYVKWLEASGARVISFSYDLSEEEQDYLFDRVNGLLFPGGDASLWIDEPSMTGFSNMTLTGKRLLNKAIEANKQGDYFPIWATCMGYELIVLAMTDNDKALNYLNSTNHVLNTTVIDADESRLYSYFDDKEIRSIEKKSALFYNHHYGLKLDTFKDNSILSDFFKLTASSVDSSGTPFVSSLEGKEIPIYVNQFHPEKNSYEWLKSVHANHSSRAIRVAQDYANFFIDEARKSKHRFDYKEIKNLNIERQELDVIDDGFVSVYIIKNKNFTSIADEPVFIDQNKEHERHYF